MPIEVSTGVANDRRRLGIVGTFDVENFGDLLFPLIAEAELKQRLKQTDLRIYAPTQPALPWPFPVTPVDRLPSEVHELSVLLIGGGQLVRFDDRYPIPLGADRFPPDAYFLGPALAAEGAGVPFVWNAIGAWTGSPRCPAREPVLGRLIAKSAIAAVRDDATQAVFACLAPAANIEMVPDTAFGMSRLWPILAESPEQKRWRAGLGLTGRYIVIQANPRMASSRHRKHFIALQQALDARIVVLPICRCHGDRAEGFPALPHDTDRHGGWLSPHRIREIIAGAELVVASSLHASITALSYGVKVVRMNLHRERKFELLDGFEGICRLGDRAALTRLLARPNGIEPMVLSHQAVLDDYWNRVAELASAEPSDRAKLTNQQQTDFPEVHQPVYSGALTKVRSLRSAVRTQLTDLRSIPRPAAWRGRAILNLDAIRQTRIYDTPYCWGQSSGLFAPDDAKRLAAEFPTQGFWTIAGVEPGRHYRYMARSLIAMGAERPGRSGTLSDAWLAFALDLLSPDYRQVVSDIVQMDLSDALLEANITQYGRGHSLSPHVDLKEKLVTQIFYFNEDWVQEDGGNLEIMASRDAATGTATITPQVGTSALLVRSHRSWHRVTPVREGHERPRRSLNVIFHLPGSRSTMWPQWPIAARRALREIAAPLLGPKFTT
jgi:lipopolysaccharide transport system ATP-binding protein